MHSCHSCTKSFSRKDSLLRHQRQFCRVIVPRRRSQNRIDSNKKSNNPIDLSNLDLIQVVTGMLTEQQRRWRKDFEKLKNILSKSNKPDDNEDYHDSLDDEHDYSDDDETHSSTQ